MTERKGIVTFKGGPLTLEGRPVTVGQTAAPFSALGNNLAPVALEQFAGKVVVISSVPSLDTPVCDAQTRRFNQEATRLGADTVVLTISMDLPFAQARWCGAAGVDRVVTLSDHRDAAFGLAYGLLVKELRLLARAVLVIDRQGRVSYFQLVPEIAQEPDYESVLAHIRTL